MICLLWSERHLIDQSVYSTPDTESHWVQSHYSEEQLKPCVLQMIIKIKLTWTWEFIVCLENEKDDS